MKRKFSETKFRWALWLGIGLFLGAMLTNGILRWLDVCSVQQGSGYFMIEQMGYFVAFLLIVIVVPIIEEFIYRFWGRGTNVGYIVTMILVPIAFMFSTYNWVASVCLLVALLLTYFLTRNDLRLILFMIITVLASCLPHLFTFADINISAIISIVEIMGLAFILSFLAVNYGLIWAIFGHSLNNLIAYFLILLPITFQTSHYNVELRPIGDAHSGYDIETQMGDTLIIKADAEMAAIMMMENQDDADMINDLKRNTYYRRGMDVSLRDIEKMKDKAQAPMLPTYTMTIIPRDVITKPNYHEVLRGMEEKGILRLDTTYNIMYVMEVENSLFLNVPEEHRKSTLDGLIVDLRLRYDLSILPGQSLNMNAPVSIGYDDLKNMSFEECVHFLKKHGIVLKRVKDNHVKMITCYGL